LAKIESFTDLIAWQKGMQLAEAVCRAVATLPAADRFDLGSQMRRSAVSIPSNVAEGFCRHSRWVYRQHIAIALGSHAELQTQLELCRRLRLLSFDLIDSLLRVAREVGRLLNGLWRSLGLGAKSYTVIASIVVWMISRLTLVFSIGGSLSS
jgi:four helix bundle protein